MIYINDVFKLSCNIINLYKILEKIGIKYGVDSVEFKNMVKKIKPLIMKEYNMYRFLGIETMVKYIEELGECEKFDLYSYRINSMLESAYEIVTEYGLDYKDYVIDNKKSDMKVILSDVICTILEIAILREIDVLVDNILNSDEYNDIYKDKFKKCHIEYIVYYFTIRSSSEIIALNYNFDIKRCPNLNFDILLNNLTQKYGVDFSNTDEEFRNGFVRMALMTLKNLINLSNDEDSIEKDYQYSFYLTAFSVYVNNMNSIGLEIIKNCLDSIKIEDYDTKCSLIKILKQKEEN